MGITKSLVPLGSMTALEMAVGRLVEAGCNPVTVVVGADHERVMHHHSQLQVAWVINKDWQNGMLSSLKCGLSSFGSLPGRLFLQLVDHCRVEAATLLAIRHESERQPRNIIRPLFAGRRGHPLVLTRDALNSVMKIGADGSLRDMLDQHSNQNLDLPVDDPYIVRDFDTLKDI